jgi:protein TonB
MNRTLTFTIWHGFMASLALHSALALPFVVNNFALPPDDLPTLVIELQGIVSEAQAEERVAQQLPDQVQQQAQPTPPPPQEAPPPPPEPEESAAAKPPEPQPQMATPPQPQATPQAKQVEDPDEQQQAQVIKTERDPDADRLREYVKRLSKKVQANLVYPDEGRKAGLQGDARVSFTLTRDGQVRPGTLTIAASSGQPKLDASALATVRACAPFEPPPREMNVSFVVGYGKKKS